MNGRTVSEHRSCRQQTSGGFVNRVAGNRHQWRIQDFQTVVVTENSWLIQTELMWDRDRDQSGPLYIMSNLHTATYVGT